MSAPHGVVILPLDMLRGPPFRDPQRRNAPIPVNWISDQFNERWWKERTRVQRKKPVHPPMLSAGASVNKLTDSEDFRNNVNESDDHRDFILHHVRGHLAEE